MLRIAWTDKVVSNDQVLQRANTSRNLLKVIVSRQIRFVGHVMRKNQVEAVALTGMIEGKRARGRQRKTFMDCVHANFFSERVINCWNSLPDSVDFSSFISFRRTVKQVDFSRFLRH